MPMERKPADPRLFQIAILLTFLVYGTLVLDFEVDLTTAVAIVGTALASQWLLSRGLALTRVDLKSALISGLSLTLLLRTDILAIGVLAGALAIGSKFLIRWRGKHVFNPANFALVILTLTPYAWSSPGQWGSVAVAIPSLMVISASCVRLPRCIFILILVGGISVLGLQVIVR